jgi:hypothetical protein
VAWQCDQDAYACSGQKCSAQSILFMHDAWAEAGACVGAAGAVGAAGMPGAQFALGLCEEARWLLARKGLAAGCAQLPNCPALCPTCPSTPAAATPCRPGEGAGAAGCLAQAAGPDGGPRAERDHGGDDGAHPAPAANSRCRVCLQCLCACLCRLAAWSFAQKTPFSSTATSEHAGIVLCADTHCVQGRGCCLAGSRWRGTPSLSSTEPSSPPQSLCPSSELSHS